jgi:hypothetical protein
MALADRPAHMPRCSLWVPLRLPEAWKRLVQAASLMTVRKLVAGQESVEDDRLCHRLSLETAELGCATTTKRAKM